MDLFLLTLLSFLLGGGGNDLLDYVPSDVYWKAKQVEVSVQSMSAELMPATDANVAKWIDELDSADGQIRTNAYQRLLHAGPIVLQRLKTISQSDSPEASSRATLLIAKINAAPRRHAVRRLMAIRKLGELGQPAAIPLLQTLLKSDELFVADYAAAAIAQIEKKPVVRARENESEKDVWRLAASTGALVHLHLASGHTLNYEEIFKQVPLSPNQDQALAIEFISGKALELAETVGNVRLDAITAGASADLDDKTGNVTFIFAGQFDQEALEALAMNQKTVFDTMDGVRVFRPDAQTFEFCPSNRRLILIAAKKSDASVAGEMVKAAKSGSGTLKNAVAMADLIRSIDVKAPVWGCLNVGDVYRKTRLLESFNSLTLLGARHGDGVELTLHAQGTDNAKIKASADRLTAMIHQMTEQVRRAQIIMPSLSMIGDALTSIKVTVDGVVVTAHVDVKQSPADSFLLPLMMTYGIPQNRAEPLPKE